VIHYWKHSGFLDGQFLKELEKISHIPCTLIHGRWDISSPLENAWNIHKKWPGSELIVVPNEGHGGKVMFGEITKAIGRAGTEIGRMNIRHPS
jgi:proline iminopeptidase